MFFLCTNNTRTSKLFNWWTQYCCASWGGN